VCTELNALAESAVVIQQVPYRVVEDGSGNVKIASSNAKRDFAPEEISAQVLRKLTEDAAKFLNDTVRGPATQPLRQMDAWTNLAEFIFAWLQYPPHGARQLLSASPSHLTQCRP